MRISQQALLNQFSVVTASSHIKLKISFCFLMCNHYLTPQVYFLHDPTCQLKKDKATSDTLTKPPHFSLNSPTITAYRPSGDIRRDQDQLQGHLEGTREGRWISSHSLLCGEARDVEDKLDVGGACPWRPSYLRPAPSAGRTGPCRGQGRERCWRVQASGIGTCHHTNESLQ